MAKKGKIIKESFSVNVRWGFIPPVGVVGMVGLEKRITVREFGRGKGIYSGILVVFQLEHDI